MYAHKKTCIKHAAAMDVPVCLFFAQVRLLTIKVSYLIDGSYYPWTYFLKSTPVVLLVCMKSYQRSFLRAVPFGKRMQR